ncbi:hypothetical protein [Serinicoccus marinus]|uniref:hypothetical protein n=1 Tax=Serinicoccus marinus TaxID=247333 RepID=UPI003CD0CC6A
MGADQQQLLVVGRGVGEADGLGGGRARGRRPGHLTQPRRPGEQLGTGAPGTAHHPRPGRGARVDGIPAPRALAPRLLARASDEQHPGPGRRALPEDVVPHVIREGLEGVEGPPARHLDQ